MTAERDEAFIDLRISPEQFREIKQHAVDVGLLLQWTQPRKESPVYKRWLVLCDVIKQGEK